MLTVYFDLVLIGYRYSIITLVFFTTYVVLQPVATVVLRKAGPRIFLPAITLLWGMTMVCFGFLTTWDQMVGLRVILGIFEAGFFPGMSSDLFIERVTDPNRMRLPLVLLVPTLRPPKAQRSFLLDRLHGFCLLRYSRLWLLQHERSGQPPSKVRTALRTNGGRSHRAKWYRVWHCWMALDCTWHLFLSFSITLLTTSSSSCKAFLLASLPPSAS